MSNLEERVLLDLIPTSSSETLPFSWKIKNHCPQVGHYETLNVPCLGA